MRNKIISTIASVYFQIGVNIIGLPVYHYNYFISEKYLTQVSNKTKHKR